MDFNKKTYQKYAKAHAPKSNVLKNCVKAFLIGGAICVIVQGLLDVYIRLCEMPKEEASALTSVSLIGIAIFLTAVGVFDKIAKHAGAGTLVPITGFANAVASPAIDAHSEGLILGVGAKIFTVAGPVLLYGTLAGAVYGVIYWLMGML